MEKEGLNKIEIAEDDMETQDKTALSYEDYRNKGGTLKKHDYKIAESFLRETSKETKKRALNVAQITQIKEVAERAGISVSPEETELYCILREQMRSSKDEDQNKEEGKNTYQLSDQELIAEILRLMGRADDLKKFQNHFHNIFK